MSRTTFLNVDDTKAGMEDLDKEKINKLIQEASKSRGKRQRFISNRFLLDSKFFKQQQRREEVEFSKKRKNNILQSFSRKIVDELKLNYLK